MEKDSDNIDKDFDRFTKLAKAEALAELIEVHKFNLRVALLSHFDPEQMVEEVETKDPEFIEHFESTRKPPWDALAFWSSFVGWSTGRVRAKYPEIWKEVVTAFNHSPPVKHLADDFFLSSAMFQIDETVKESGFEEQ